MTTTALPIARPPAASSRPLRIRVSTGTGDGPTELAAFDAALHDAGVENYNLLCLSSVIPPRASVVRERHRTPPDDYGRRLYVVMSQMRQSAPGRRAHAGIGWVQQGEGGCGLFVELHDEDRGRLEHDLHTTLAAMRSRRDIEYGPAQTVIAGTTCIEAAVCALVVAVYACEPW